MSTDLLNRLEKAITRYERKEYSEHDFHTTLESIIQTITESDLADFRDFLFGQEANLERIDFLINDENKREEYLKVIEQIKESIARRHI